MKYYKHPETSEVYAYETEAERDEYGAPELVEMTPEEVESHINPKPTLEEAKERKNAELTRLCLQHIDSGFEFDGHVYDSDERSQTNIIGTANAVQAGLPLPEGFSWRTKDNQNVPFDSQKVIALGAALLAHVNTQYSISWWLKEQVAQATTVDDVETITWPD